MTAPTLLQGDCFEVLQTLEADSVDACVTDPPYGLSFMGKHWDKGVPDADMWRQVYRVLKPGAHLLSFFGTRTYHRGVVAIEDAGFEIRDQIGWLYGSGFPKSLSVSKAIDKAAGAEREVVGSKRGVRGADGTGHESAMPGKATGVKQVGIDIDITAPATEAAQQWDGWGTALKPAWEPVVVARKPLIGTVAQNVLEHGTGGINIDGCRVGTTVETWPSSRSYMKDGGYDFDPGEDGETVTQDTGTAPPGRWPANICHDGSDEVLAEFAKYGESKSTGGRIGKKDVSGVNVAPAGQYSAGDPGFGDTGTAARFFYTAKASKDDRNDGLHDWEHEQVINTDTPPGTKGSNSPRAGAGRLGAQKNHHPTVKPTSLMRYLVRLVTPKGGLVLDPFAGSGTTLIAAYREDCRGLGIELDPEYFKMANHRIDKATAQLRLGL